MAVSVHSFTRALTAPDLWLRRLHGITVEVTDTGLPALHRTTEFVDAVVHYRGERYLLAMPLSREGMFHAEHTLSALDRLKCPSLTSVRILRGELTDEEGNRQDLILQPCPGCSFEEAATHALKAELQKALDTLQEELQRAGFVHRNLKPSNIRWDGHRFIPIRYQDAVIGGDPSGDRKGFDLLRARLDELGGDFVSDFDAPYDPAPDLKGHLWVGHTFEGLTCVRDKEGYGYVDDRNQPVIPSQYLWADDFAEGRAVVERTTGMGVIDREGRCILPMMYDIVDYHPEESIFEVRRGDLWAEFDYTGQPLTEFAPRGQKTLNE